MGTDHARGNLPYGFVPGDRRDFGATCNFKVGPEWALARPEPVIRGEIARALIYMMYEYGLPLPERMSLDLLGIWNRDDPPDAEELDRNNRIEMLQGNRNRFIDWHELAESFDPLLKGR